MTISGKIIQGLRQVRNGPRDLTFLIKDTENDSLDLHVIPEGYLKTYKFPIPASSELHQMLLNPDSIKHKLLSDKIQFVMDRHKKLMIVYDTEKDGIQYVNFYDVEEQTTLLRVRD